MMREHEKALAHKLENNVTLFGSAGWLVTMTIPDGVVEIIYAIVIPSKCAILPWLTNLSKDYAILYFYPFICSS